MSDTATDQSPERLRKTMRLHKDTVQQVEYWRKKEGLTETEFYVQAVEEKVARMNGDYDLPTLEIQRLNQLIDEIRALSTNAANLEIVVNNGFDSLIGMTRGDSYLLDQEDGELAVAETASAAITG